VDIFVLDSSAVLRYIDREAGGIRVRGIFESAAADQAEIYISAVQWGEIAGRLRKRIGANGQKRALENLGQLGLQIIPVTAERAVHAGELRVDRKIAYADAFALDLAMQSPDRVLVTADYGLKAVADLARIEFLPVK
jgi:predicted nucleic acid-binding protein